MTTWHIGISKLEQILADESWGNAPIGAGPFSLTYDPDRQVSPSLVRGDLVGKFTGTARTTITRASGYV